MSILARCKLWIAQIIWLATPPSKRSALPPGAYESPLDKLNNSVLDAIEAGDYEEAEKRSLKLLREYPEAFYGHTRLALLREIQGRYREAAKHYSKALKMMRKDPEGADPEMIRAVTAHRDGMRLKAKAKG